MAQFTTTTQLVRERTVAEGFTPDLSDVILADHGTGSKRHRAFTIEEIGELLMGGSGIVEIHLRKSVSGSNVQFYADMDGKSLKFSNEGGGVSDATESELKHNELSFSVESQGYKTDSKVTKDGLEISYGHGEGAESDYTITKVLYDKVETPAIVGKSAGEGSADAKELRINSGLHIENENGGSHYLHVDGPTKLRGSTEITHDVTISKHDNNGSDEEANLDVPYGLTRTKRLQVGPDNNKVLEASENNGLQVHKNASFTGVTTLGQVNLNSTVSVGGVSMNSVGAVVVDITSQTGSVYIETVLQNVGNINNAVAIVVCDAGQTIYKGVSATAKKLTVQEDCALQFYRATPTSLWLPMFDATWST